MAKPVSTYVRYERRVNLGDYNSACVTFSHEEEIEPGDDLDDLHERMWQMAKENVRAQLVPLHRDYQAQVEQLIGKVPVAHQQALRELIYENSVIQSEEAFLGMPDGQERVVLVGEEAKQWLAQREATKEEQQ